MTKTPNALNQKHFAQSNSGLAVSNFEHFNFDIVSNFDIRYSDFFTIRNVDFSY